MSSRGCISASVLVLSLVALVAMTGCAKRYHGSIKDDPQENAEPSRPTRKWTPAVHRVPAAPAQLSSQAAMPTEPPPASPPAEPKAQGPIAKLERPAPPAKNADDTCVSSEKCAAQLRAMLNDQTRSWIGKPQTVDEHFSGTRQFAYLALSKVLKCAEIAGGLRDVQANARMSATSGKFPAHRVAQIKDLNKQVETALARERQTRCPQ